MLASDEIQSQGKKALAVLSSVWIVRFQYLRAIKLKRTKNRCTHFTLNNDVFLTSNWLDTIFDGTRWESQINAELLDCGKCSHKSSFIFLSFFGYKKCFDAKWHIWWCTTYWYVRHTSLVIRYICWVNVTATSSSF